MSQPSVKFISHFASYIVFICLIIASNVSFPSQENSLEKFSSKFGNYYFANFTRYIENEDLAYRPQFRDFFIRPYYPNVIDIVIRLVKINYIEDKIK